eukprot:1650170-Pyramimonas_sp.AAC.1
MPAPATSSSPPMRHRDHPLPDRQTPSQAKTSSQALTAKGGPTGIKTAPYGVRQRTPHACSNLRTEFTPMMPAEAPENP